MHDDRWLSSYTAHLLDFRCRRCKIAKVYDADKVLAERGDLKLNGMCVHLSEALNCPRVYSLSPSDGCWMTVSTRPKPMPDPVQEGLRMMALEKLGMRVLRDTKISEIRDWEEPFAACECGRTKRLDRQKLIREFGPLTASEMAKKMRCRHCGLRSCRLAVTQMPR